MRSGTHLFRQLCARLLVIVFALKAPLALALNDRPANKLPNLIIILADDLGYGDIGVYGAQRIKTPHIDSLAANGMRFTNAYASANVCSPSRAGLMTGRYAIRSGLAWKVVGADQLDKGLPAGEQSIAELALEMGYRTMLVGKWHLGTAPRFFPLQHGFQQFFGVLHSNDMPDFHLWDDDTVIDRSIDQSQLTKRYTQRAIDFINDASERPFLLLMSHTFPHIPLYASEQFLGRSAAGLYGDTVEELDWSTGQLLAALRQNGKLSNTLIIFTSDNGPFFEGSAGGLRGGKGNAWEGGYRVPFIASWPAYIEGGSVSESLTMNIDLLPTLADIAGIAPAAAQIDGRSLLPVFRAPRHQVHQELLFFNNENIIGLRNVDWKFVSHAYYTGSLGAFEKFDQLPGFAAPYELLLDANGIDGEAYSYAQRHPEIVQRFRKDLQRARAEFYPLRTRPSEPTYPP